MNLSEPLHITNGVRPGGILGPNFFAVYLDDLSLEPSNIKAWLLYWLNLIDPLDVCG